MTPNSIFFNPSSNETAEDNTPPPFSVLLIGELCDAVPGTTNFSSIDLFFKSIAVETIDKYSPHILHRDQEVAFVIHILKKTWNRLYSQVLKESHLIFLVPYSIEDFNRCKNFLTKYQTCLSPHMKIYCLNEFPKDSQEYSIIAKKATLSNYKLVAKDELNTVLENERTAYLKNPQAFLFHPATETPEIETSSKCTLL